MRRLTVLRNGGHKIADWMKGALMKVSRQKGFVRKCLPMLVSG